MADPGEPADVQVEARTTPEESTSIDRAPVNTTGDTDSSHSVANQDLPQDQNAAEDDFGTGPESTENQYVTDTTFSVPVLVHMNNGELSWSNIQKKVDESSFGDFGASGLSIRLYPKYTRTLYSYIKLEVHQLGLPEMFPDTHICSIVVYLTHAESVSMTHPEREVFQHELASLNSTGLIHDECALLKITATTVYLDMNGSVPSTFDGIESYSASAFNSLRDFFAEPAEISFTLLAPSVMKPQLERMAPVLQALMERERRHDANIHPLALNWFPLSENAMVMSYGHAPRVGTPDMPPELPQDAINRYVDRAHYMVLQLVSSVNEASFASQEVRLCAKNTHQILILGELPKTTVNRQILVLLKPNKDAAEKFLPLMEEKCTMHICGVKLLEELSDDKLERQASACAVALPGYFDDADEDLSEIEFALQISEMIRENHAIEFAVEEIEALRYTGNSPRELNQYTQHVTELAKSKLRSPAPDFDNTSAPSDDKLLAWSAVRHAISIQGLPPFWQVYHITMPLKPLDDDQKLVTPLSERKSIDTNLHIPPVPDSINMADFIGSKLRDDDQLLNVVVRRMDSDKTIKAECAAINAIHHPAGCDTPPSTQSRAAFEMMLDMVPTSNNNFVDLISSKPGIQNVIARMSFSPDVMDEYEDLIQTIRDKAEDSNVPKPLLHLANNLDSQKQRSLLSLHSICEGVSFLPGVAGCGKTHFLLSLIAFAKYGEKGEECPSLYIAPNNQAVDDTAVKLHRVFKELGVEDKDGHLDIIRLYAQDREYRRSDLISEDLEPEKAMQLVLDDADDAARFLACNQMAHISAEIIELRKAKHRCPKNLTLDAYAREYLREHSHDYEDLQQAMHRTLNSEATAEDRDTIRDGVRQLFKDALSNFKGVVCTTPVASASALAKCFRPDIVFIDEAGRLHETAAMIPIAWYDPKAWIFTGDARQLQPYHRMLFLKKGEADPNPFYATSKVSLLQRACNADYPTAQLSYNHRQHGGLHRLPSRMFYGNGMGIGPELKERKADFKTLMEHVRNIIDHTNTLKSDKRGRFRVKFRGAIEQKSDFSFRNTSHAGWCLEKAIAITKTDAQCIPPRGDEKAKVLILCLYAEQVLQYKSFIRKMIESGTSRAVFERIDVRTLDSSQGEQSDIVFIDFVRTEDVGFCDEPHRLCLSLTRSKGCEIILMNESMMYRRGSKRLGFIVDHVPDVVTQDCCEYCGDHSHRTKDCPGPKICTNCEGEHPRARCPDIFCPNCQQKGHAVSTCDQSRHCFLCGSDSHTETHCTEKQRVRCYTCGEIGHTKFTCTRCPGCYTDTGNHAPSCESAGLACRNCHLFGHRSNECSNDRAMRCRNCDGLGHVAASCSQTKCKECQKLGHIARECPDKTCRTCNEKGHDQRQCPERQCFRCKGRGHDKRDCQIAQSQQCDRCLGMGHVSKSCPLNIHEANRNALTGQAAKDARDVAEAFHREFETNNTIFSAQEIRDTDGTGQEDDSATQQESWEDANTGQEDVAVNHQDDWGTNTGQEDATANHQDGWGTSTGQEDAGTGGGATDW